MNITELAITIAKLWVIAAGFMAGMALGCFIIGFGRAAVRILRSR